jgi:hypothetical protein
MLKNSIDIDLTKNFILERCNDDGGYSFARTGPSTASETFYSISSLLMLGIDPPGKEKTVNWLRARQLKNGCFQSIQTAFYVTNTLKLLGKKIAKIASFLDWCYRHYKNGLFSENINGSPSLKATYMITSCIGIYADNIYKREIHNTLLERPLPDNLTDIFRIVRICENIEMETPHREEIISFVEKCRTPAGYYSLIPKATSFLEHTYHAVYLSRKFDIPFDKKKIREHILACKNRDGGFGRAPNSASFVQYTYYAIKILKLLDK